jgi:hypothetical protein
MGASGGRVSRDYGPRVAWRVSRRAGRNPVPAGELAAAVRDVERDLYLVGAGGERDWRAPADAGPAVGRECDDVDGAAIELELHRIFGGEGHAVGAAGRREQGASPGQAIGRPDGDELGLEEGHGDRAVEDALRAAGGWCDGAVGRAGRQAHGASSGDRLAHGLDATEQEGWRRGVSKST